VYDANLGNHTYNSTSEELRGKDDLEMLRKIEEPRSENRGHTVLLFVTNKRHPCGINPTTLNLVKTTMTIKKITVKPNSILYYFYLHLIYLYLD
jgi:hypothetical protein